ncbi:MAG: hypothetical protein DRJ67_07170 [Thermoprotei archaeon]|nr:MAG: hypothetical protein DRJ67_07170 [Thermoprotei archaeon]
MLLTIKPLGRIRLATTPISGPETFGSQRILGIPPPSTILGLLGAAAGVKLDPGDVKKDPLLGISALLRALHERGFGMPVIEGPLLRVKKNGTCWAIPIFTKEGVNLVEYEKCRRTLIEEGMVYSEARIGYATARLEPGIALRDTIEGSWHRVVALGYTFRRGYVQYVNAREEKGLDVEFVYKLNLERRIRIGKRLLRLGGEGRYAIVKIEEGDLPGIASPLNAEPGTYLVLNYWPLVPRSGHALYLEKNEVIGLEPFKDPSQDIIGVPKIIKRSEGGSPAKRVIRLGLGFSEVIKQRRPQILALPPGTLVRLRLKASQAFPSIYKKLLKAGYASLLNLAAELPGL